MRKLTYLGHACLSVRLPSFPLALMEQHGCYWNDFRDIIDVPTYFREIYMGISQKSVAKIQGLLRCGMNNGDFYVKAVVHLRYLAELLLL